ncbi:MAG: hypothetical protein ABI594_02205 [Ginsengibacter sp.]
MRSINSSKKKFESSSNNLWLSSQNHKSAELQSPHSSSAFNFNNVSIFSNRPGAKNELQSPKIKVAGFSSLLKNLSAEKNKSKSRSTEDQDQSAVVTAFAATATGVDINAEVVDGSSSPDYPDGLRWTQTIITNVEKGGPLLPAPVEYVDPKPNDDAKPFYWTDAEEAGSPGKFHDAPSRKPRAAGTLNWDAILSINGVNGKSVERFDSIGYGFSVDSAGNVTTREPVSPANVGSHISTLGSEFPGWTFI